MSLLWLLLLLHSGWWRLRDFFRHVFVFLVRFSPLLLLAGSLVLHDVALVVLMLLLLGVFLVVLSSLLRIEDSAGIIVWIHINSSKQHATNRT